MAKTPLITPSEGKVGQVLDLAKHVIRKSGVSDEALQRLIEKGGEFQEEFSNVLRRFTVNFQRDMCEEEGWELIEDTNEPTSISVSGLELVPFLKRGENYIGGEELVRRARTELRANLGQRHAEWLLEHQEEIPEEFRKSYLVFPGTVWLDRRGLRRVACLHWRGGRWHLSFDWLESGFGRRGRLVRPRE